MDADDLAQRILLDLRNAFKKDPLIDEFDILPVHEAVRNSCPVIHVQHKIALEDWCVKHVYVYCYTNFFTWRRKPTKIDSETLLMWTMAILLINPDIETVWNARKELVCQNSSLPEDELKFCDIVLSRKPKSSQAFAHRKWVLLQLKHNHLSSCSLQQVINHEFLLVTKVADSYANNYYAWCHRSWIIQELLYCCLKTVTEELSRMENWVSSHVSDFSGFHYRQFLISCFHHQPSPVPVSECPMHPKTDFGNDCSTHCHVSCNTDHDSLQLFANVLEKELIFLSELQTIYPGHESLWNHRRFIVHGFQSLYSGDAAGLGDIRETLQESVLQCKRHKLESVSCKVSWDVLREEEFLENRIKAAKGLDWEQKLIKRYVKWLHNVLRWNVKLQAS